MTSAESHLPAISKEERVRVESSKNRFTTVRPRRAGSFLTERCCTSCISAAVSNSVRDVVDARGRRWRAGACSCGRSCPRGRVAIRTSSYPSDSSSRTITRSPRALGRFLPTWSARIGSSRWPRSTSTASRTVVGPAEVVHRVERGPDRAPGEEHVVDEYDDLAVDPAGRHLGVLGTAGRVLAQVVAVHRDVEGAERHLDALDLGDPLGDAAGEVDAAGGDAEEDEPLGALVALEDLVGDAGQCPGDVTGVEDGAPFSGDPREGVLAREQVRRRLGAQAPSAPDLLLRLTGRLVKGCRSWVTVAAATRSWRTGATRLVASLTQGSADRPPRGRSGGRPRSSGRSPRPSRAPRPHPGGASHGGGDADLVVEPHQAAGRGQREEPRRPRACGSGRRAAARAGGR